ncbi:hypothetical protein [Streptomyces sp. NPDC047028]|uniref:hypothetical protein n=1 Tax=Streptomyces sp. NPDC047028 TaxID=3155793 RepID=UPI0033E950AC
MRKLQQVVIAAVAVAGGLSAVGAAPAMADGYGSEPQATTTYRPYQECSPQTVSENDVPVPVLGYAGTVNTNCRQYNIAG